MNNDTVDRVYYDILENPALYEKADLAGIKDYWQEEAKSHPYSKKVVELVSDMLADRLAKKRAEQLAQLGL